MSSMHTQLVIINERTSSSTVWYVDSLKHDKDQSISGRDEHLMNITMIVVIGNVAYLTVLGVSQPFERLEEAANG